MIGKGFGLDLSGNESSKVGSLARRGRISVEYDLREAAGKQGSDDEAPGTFTIRGLYDRLPWSNAAYEAPSFMVSDLEDLQLLLIELKILAGKATPMGFEKRLTSGHYDSIQRRKNFIPDALKELGLSGDFRAHDMLKLALYQCDGDVKRSWPLLRSMVKAAGLAAPAPTALDSLDDPLRDPSVVDTKPG